MAITITNQPNQFFYCTSPVIFEFTTDAEIGNFDDYVCDVVISSLYTDKTAIIKNIFPNTQTKIFSVDASEFFKALQLNGFEFDVRKDREYSIEKFAVSLNIRDGSQPDDSSQIFDNYIFDNFIFTSGSGAVDTITEEFHSVLGERLLFDNYKLPVNEEDVTFLTPEVIEVCRDFENTISVFANELPDLSVTVGGVSESLFPNVGVTMYLLSEDQLNAIRSLSEVTVTNQNPEKKLFAYDFKDTCEPIVQFRFFNSKGGFSYFYSVPDTESADRSKVEFYDRNYYNQGERNFTGSGVQSNADYSSEMGFKGSKPKELKELFDMLLRSPKVEMNLFQINGNIRGEGVPLFVECEITGTWALLPRTFDYTLKAKIKNTGNFKL